MSWKVVQALLLSFKKLVATQTDTILVRKVNTVCVWDSGDNSGLVV